MTPRHSCRMISVHQSSKRDRARSSWRFQIKPMSNPRPEPRRVCSGDIRTAWDRHEPMKPSRTAPRGATLLRFPNSANSAHGLSGRVMRFGDRSSQKIVEQASKAPCRAGGAIATLPRRRWYTVPLPRFPNCGRTCRSLTESCGERPRERTRQRIPRVCGGGGLPKFRRPS